MLLQPALERCFRELSPPFEFSSLVQTNQSLNFHLRSSTLQAFASPAARELSRTAPALPAVLDDLASKISAVKRTHRIDDVWLLGHNILTCDLLCLHSHCGRLDTSFSDWLQTVGTVAIVDTLAIARDMRVASNPALTVEALYKQHCGMDMAGAHDALVDSKATLAVAMSPAFSKAFKDAKQIVAYHTEAVMAHITKLSTEFHVCRFYPAQLCSLTSLCMWTG